MAEINPYSFRVYLPLSWLFFAISYALTCRITSYWFIWACLGVTFMGVSLVFAILATMPIAKLHTPTSAAIHFLSNSIVLIAGYFLNRQCEYATKNVVKVQQSVLKRYMVQNKDTEFGRKWGFGNVKTRQDYVARVPLTTYDDYKGYIERIEQGENNLLTKDPVDRLSVSSGRATPAEAHAFMSESAQTYIHLYYALHDPNIAWVMSTFGGTLLAAIQVLQLHWKDLAEDIRDGKISNVCNIPEDAYRKLKVLPPDPQRASELEFACSAGWEGILKRLWRKLDHVVATTTGSHAIFRDRIQYLAGPRVTILSPAYGASEAPVGAAMDLKQDRDQTYTVIPNWGFYEFIPEAESGSKSPKTLFIEQLKKGERYEIVVTSVNGFYRYRLGDVLKVVDFYNESPVVEFCTRVGSVLDLRGEKTTEDMVFNALKLTEWPERDEIQDYTTTDCVTFAKLDSDNVQGDKGLFYVIFVEFEKQNRKLTNEEMARFDEALQAESYPYKSFRVKGAIETSRILVVKRGTFQKVKSFILQRNEAISNQYKTPRYLKTTDVLSLLMDNLCN